MIKKLIKILFPHTPISEMKSRYEINRARILSFVTQWKFARRILILFNPNCLLEYSAVLAGRTKYYQDTHQTQLPYYLLRRNTHRLEKGLMMTPRRPVFGTGYILDTVLRYKEALSCDVEHTDNVLNWAADILKEYFSIVSPHPEIDRAGEIFNSIKHPPPEEIANLPYTHSLIPASDVQYDDFYQLSIQRRSVRWYLNKPVPRELIDQAIEIALLSPSSCNRQPFEFRVYDDPKLVKEISLLPWGTAGFADGIPVIVAVIGKLRAFPHERDRHLIYIDSSLASMSFMYALETLGLSSCALNWPDIKEKDTEVKNMLNLEPDERPIMFIALGYPDPSGKIGFSKKKCIESIRSYNKI